MALCTKCGAIMHDDDADKHICDITKVPEKGKEKIPMNTDKVV
jgi:hypothetical protein